MSSEALPVVPLLIDGVETASTPSIQFSVFSNSQQKDVYLAESATEVTARAAADAALASFKTWKKVPAVERRNLLLKYAQILRANADELCQVQQAETSAPELLCRKNIELATGLIEETAACITSLKGSIPQTESPSILALSFTVPIGPVLVIAP
jgi:acyl-CoA reductase-like NAD-dependent aldehyde dehydrogenase